ncbi:MAG: DNA repair protein RecO [Pseudomonadota bacterium]
MTKAVFQKAFVLHYRAYRDTSLLVDLLTTKDGRLTVVARAAKRPTSPWKGLLQPFVALNVHYQGKRELKTLYQIEPLGKAIPFTGMTLWCGLYLNELLMKTLHSHDACPNIFALYEQTLIDLAEHTEHQKPILRRFEKRLLSSLGYDLNLVKEAEHGSNIMADSYYQYLPEHGIIMISPQQTSTVHSNRIFSGKSLLAIQQEQWHDDETLRDAKRLLRLALSPLLSRPLNSPQILAGY